MRELLEYWRSRFDWRAQEAKLNRFRQYTVQLQGIEVHFIHEPGRGPAPMPLLISSARHAAMSSTLKRRWPGLNESV